MADSNQEAQEAARKAVEESYKRAAEHRSAATTTGEIKVVSKPSNWTPELVCKLSLGIGIFAIVSFALVTLLLWKRRSAEQILRTFGILVIIFAAVFLVIAGYSDTQITPVIGLLGTIAGYLLGRRIEPATSQPDRAGQREE
jgi:hypothetical protein